MTKLGGLGVKVGWGVDVGVGLGLGVVVGRGSGVCVIVGSRVGDEVGVKVGRVVLVAGTSVADTTPSVTVATGVGCAERQPSTNRIREPNNKRPMY